MMSSERRIELGATFCWAETSEEVEAWWVERNVWPGDNSERFRTGDIRLASCTHTREATETSKVRSKIKKLACVRASSAAPWCQMLAVGLCRERGTFTKTIDHGKRRAVCKARVREGRRET